jgi:hypothetical protein
MNSMKTFDDDELERLLSTKSFGQLSEDEKDFVLKKLGSEEQYHAMRRVTLALITSKADLSPDPDILPSLQKKMSEARHHSSFSLAGLFSFRIPAYATVLLIIFTSVVTWFASRDKDVNVSSSFVEVVKRDTVFVTHVKLDTVFKTRVVYRRVETPFVPDRNYFQVVRKGSEENVPEERSISMKEKQELEMLLVSGSE